MTKKRYKGFFSKRLRSQLLLVFMITITLLIGGISVFSYQGAENVVRHQSGEIMQQYFRQNEYNILRYTKEVEKLLRLLMIQDSLQDYMRQGWEEKFENVAQVMKIFNYTNAVMGNYDYIDSVYYYGNDGTALGVQEDKNMLTEFPDSSLPWYGLDIRKAAEKTTGKVLWFGGYSSQDFSLEKEEEDIPYITAAGTIWLETGRYATIVVNIRQDIFAKSFARTENRNERENYIINQQGKIIVHQNQTILGTKVEIPIEELKDSNEEYFMQDGIQINYHKIDGLPWIFITEVSTKSLYGELDSLKRWFLVLAIGGIVVAAALSAYSLSRLTKPLNELRHAMGRMENGALGETLEENSKNELGMLGGQFNRMSESIRTMVRQIKEMEEEKRILEKEALQGQLNPHFLFNTLSNMRFMAKLGQNEELENCFAALGQMLRPMYRSEGELWSLREELNYLSNYITIMNCRFGGKLSMEFEIEEMLLDFQVLKFILQPLIENAIEHGFNTGEEGMIVLGASLKERQISMYVEDNGKGIQQEELCRLQEHMKQAENQKELYRGHVGIVNIHRRLKVHFGPEYGLHLESVPGEATCIYLTMPGIEKIEKTQNSAENRK